MSNLVFIPQVIKDGTLCFFKCNKEDYLSVFIPHHQSMIELLASSKPEFMQSGQSCLFTACQYGRLDVAKYLIEKGGKELLLMKGFHQVFF
jgi:hypothetical protein